MALVSLIDGLIYPAVIAHRGACRSRPENSLAAFSQAISAGADMIELDVRLTADGVMVVVHDPHVEGPGGRITLVSELTFRQLRHSRLADAAAISVPTLQEVLSLVRGRVGLEIEIKQLSDEPGPPNLGLAAAEAVARLLNESEFVAVLVSCFEPRTLARVRECAPQIATGLETEGLAGLVAGLEQCVAAGHAFVLPDVPTLLGAGRGIVDQAHRLGLRLIAWVADDPVVLAELFAMGVDAIETDDLDIAIPIRDRARQ